MDQNTFLVLNFNFSPPPPASPPTTATGKLRVENTIPGKTSETTVTPPTAANLPTTTATPATLIIFTTADTTQQVILVIYLSSPTPRILIKKALTIFKKSVAKNLYEPEFSPGDIVLYQ
jgi:hypothetical protein